MSWISFVITTLIFYTPMLGIGSLLGGQLSPVLSSVALLALSLAVWLAVWGLLVLSERAREHPSAPDLLTRSRLRDGMLYSLYPYSMDLAVWLAGVVMAYALIQVIMSLFGMLAPTLFGPQTIVLSLFALIVFASYRFEQRAQYDGDVQRARRDYKERQERIALG